MIEKEDWAGLYALDELQRELQAGNVLNGFETPPATFAPTFKVRRSVWLVGRLVGLSLGGMVAVLVMI
jgi:hypothetical protein